MAYWFLLLFLQTGLSIKVLTFEKSLDGKIVHQIIHKPTPLPEIFTLCSTFKENLVYEYNSFFIIYGASGESWMTMSTFDDGHIALWIKINKRWIEITVIPDHLMNTWTHVCIKVDTLSGNLSVLINEDQPIMLIVPELTQHTPKDLKEKLYIGQTENTQESLQYLGEVANFNIFSGSKKVKNLMENACDHVGDIVNKDTQWKRFGDVKESNEESWKICNNNDIYRVAIPIKNNWDTSRDFCDKLGHGHITEPQNEKDIEDVTSLLQKMNSSCSFVWTSISDEDQEGEFRSSITGEIITFQPWFEGQPNGKEGQNHVAFEIKSKRLYDDHQIRQHCSACDLQKSLTVTLLGGCEDTSFGKHLFFAGCI